MLKEKLNKLMAICMCLAVFSIILSTISLDDLEVNAATSNDLSISQNGITFICDREGFSSTCYYDGNQSSIGYGTKCGTSAHASGQHSITKEEAMAAMMNEINSSYVPNVRRQTVGITMNQNQFDALVSFTYNTGGGTTMIKNSPLVKYLQGSLTESQARSQFSIYIVTNSATGKIDQGLINRRNAEADLFFSGNNSSGQSSVPRIENARVSQITKTGYIVQCEVYDEVNLVTRVAFPTWTTKTDSNGNDQDDIVWADGVISGATATFEVKISDHNNELGYYRTHIFCYNTTGVSSSVAVPDVYIEQTAPSISNVEIILQTTSSYTVQCEVKDSESGIDRVQFPTWTSANGQDDLITDWGSNESVRGTIDGNTLTYTVKISDHNNGLGEYETHIYAYDKCGNYTSSRVKVIIEDTPPKISDVKIVNQTPTSYTIQCTVSDSESGIDRVQFPTWTSENHQDDIAKNWGTNEKVRGVLNDGIATFTVYSSEHNNEVGEYNTHIYAYDKCGNYVSVGVKVNLGVYKLSVDPNGGTYDNSTALVTKKDSLKYGYNYWSNIGESEYGNATRIGYVLTGYYDKPTGGIMVYDSNGVALDTEYFMDLAYYGDSDLTVYAQWTPIKGDVNSDGYFDIADVVLIQKWLLTVPDTNLANWQAADLCEDGVLDVFDLCLMKRKLIYG